jgi:hypothetical protein
LKLKEYNKQIKTFEDTAAPAGYSLLWDDTDKKYGYINNFTGEVTTEYPTGSATKKPEVRPPRKDVSNLNIKKIEENRPWKYSDDGSISGILGGGNQNQNRKSTIKTGSETGNDKILTQTDILKDAIRIERAQTHNNKEIRSNKNEKEDRRLARLGIRIEPNSESNQIENETETATLPEEPAAEIESENNEMDISDESDQEIKKIKKKKKKNNKNSKNKKSKLDMMENWKRRQEDEQTSLWSQLGI